MVLPLVVIEDLTRLDSSYSEKHQGFFVKRNRTLCYKPDKNSNMCYEVNTGKVFEYDNEPVYKAYIEGGTRKLKCLEEDVDKDIHPSYGLISFSRVSCNPPMALFGSSIKHSNPIRMVIYHAEQSRNINHDWHYSDGRIVEIEMSQSQFADAITSLNMGDGVPCTIRFTEMDGYMPECKFTSKIEQYKREFSTQLSDTEIQLSKGIETVQEIFDTKKSLSKADKETILNILQAAKREVGCNAEYVLDSFTEQMDKTVKEAKGEIESFVQNQVHKFVSSSLSNVPENPMIEEGIANTIKIE